MKKRIAEKTNPDSPGDKGNIFFTIFLEISLNVLILQRYWHADNLSSIILAAAARRNARYSQRLCVKESEDSFLNP